MKVKMKISISGWVEISTGDLDERSFEGIERFTQCLPANPKYTRFPPSIHLDWGSFNPDLEVNQHIICTIEDAQIVNNGEKIEHNKTWLSFHEYKLLTRTFAHNGSCGCSAIKIRLNDYKDDGCPWCNKDKTEEWKNGLDSLADKLR